MKTQMGGSLAATHETSLCTRSLCQLVDSICSLLEEKEGGEHPEDEGKHDPNGTTTTSVLTPSTLGGVLWSQTY